MNYILPMAGYGKRCLELGDFKPFIKVDNLEIFKHCVRGLNIGSDDTVLCILSRESSPPEAKDIFIKYFKSLNVKRVTVIVLDKVLQGPALTVIEGAKLAIRKYNHFDDTQVHVVNTDQIITYNNIDLKYNECAMPLYFNNRGSSCYVKLSNNQQKIIDIKEKELISSHASAGVYLFGNINLLLNCIIWGKQQDDLWVIAPKYETKELFIGPCMNYALEIGYDCYPMSVISKIDLGSTRSINKIKNKINEHTIW